LLIEFLYFILLYPAFNALLVQFCIFPSIKKFIIDPYYAEHPNEDIEKRRRLGLEIESEVKAESVFEDSAKVVDEEDTNVIFED